MPKSKPIKRPKIEIINLDGPDFSSGIIGELIILNIDSDEEFAKATF